MSTERRILVTGAAGFIGSWITRRLAASGYAVVATDRVPRCPVGMPIVAGDLDDDGFVADLAALGPFDTIVHFAWPKPRLDDTSLLDTSVVTPTNQVVRLLELAREQKAAFVYASTAMVYGNGKAPFREDMRLDPTTPYAYAKAAGELAVHYHFSRSDLPYTILRPSVVYGPGQQGEMFVPSLLRALATGNEFPMTSGEQLRDFIYVDDLADLVLSALAARARAAIVNVGSGVGIRLREVAAIANDLTGGPRRYVLGAIPYRASELWEYSLDIARARSSFGWSPKTMLTRGLALTISTQRMCLPGETAATRGQRPHPETAAVAPAPEKEEGFPEEP